MVFSEVLTRIQNSRNAINNTSKPTVANILHVARKMKHTQPLAAFCPLLHSLPDGCTCTPAATARTAKRTPHDEGRFENESRFL
mmetsp:Transcript_1617/g.4861  ORF Transcript_1617/g.4861 Transcript_1617/m.4861 type:complete len:84 (+) Transcript_1617:45-296(+)